MKKIQYILSCSLLLLMASCEKDTEPTNFAPSLTTGAASDIYRMGATLSGSIQKSDATVVNDFGILYSELQSMAEYTEVKATSADVTSFSISLKDLQPGKTYYYCSYAGSGYSLAKGEIKSFTTTESNAPVFGELQVTNKDEKSFSVSTTIIDEGGSELVIRGFCWKLSGGGDPTVEDNVSNVSLEATAFTTRVNDLTPDKAYVVRPYAINGRGVGYGESVTITTNTSTAPVVSSITPKDSTAVTVEVEARVLSHGDSPITEKGFCWSSETPTPTTGHLKKVVDGETDTFGAVIDELRPNTTYYIRAYAINGQGTSYGEVFVFVTKELPTLRVLDIEVDGVNVRAYGQVTPPVPFIHFGFAYATNENDLLNGTGDYISIDIHADATTTYDQTTGEFSGVLIDIKPNITYYIYAFAGVNVGSDYWETIYSDIVQFTTGASQAPGIYSLEDLVAFRDAKNAGGDLSKWKNEEGVINIFSDIDMSSIDNWDMINEINQDEILDGNEHTISGLKMQCTTTERSSGFILTNRGLIRNLHLGTGLIEVIGKDIYYVAALCGFNDRGKIVDCSSEVNIVAQHFLSQDGNAVFISGICGYSGMEEAQILRCVNRGNIEGGHTLSGICSMNNGVIKECANYGTMTGTMTAKESTVYVSGIGNGLDDNCQIFNCTNYGSINARQAWVAGGICAASFGKTELCTNMGDIIGGGNTGGICGYLLEDLNAGAIGILQECTNKGEVTGEHCTGGICGSVMSSTTYLNNTNDGTVNGVTGTDANAIGCDER
ncbi:fibronectin type III domain-containing protein [Bacteroides sp. UBA939]|uniref:fibronectin type III domain-containing protein n=1 Tax=Bacteroides sp. UBA939 TaxID=1946092 RepID=UPI0025C36619|nr:fibronectin type III domain-containing protein [Bacteroides sp. UBA939]